MLHHHHGSFIPSLLLQYLWRKYDFWVHYNLIILFTHRRWTGVNLMTRQKGTTRRSLWMATEIWNGYCLLHRRRSWLVESAAVWKLLLKVSWGLLLLCKCHTIPRFDSQHLCAYVGYLYNYEQALKKFNSVLNVSFMYSRRGEKQNRVLLILKCQS